MTCYKGMRWLKCDLHMHTPADSQHWAGEGIVGGQEAKAAKDFADACYQSGLDVVGITDHNFLSKDFLSHLRVAFDEDERGFSHKITLFPGFEFEAAGIGRGVHVLCLFEPSSDMALLESILTECGVGYPRVNMSGQLAKSDKNLKDILKLVQDKHSGIVMLPHAMSNDGIFDNSSISEWLQKDQFTNPDLLAVEVPKPISQLSKAFQTLFRSGNDCLQDWKRIRPIATLMSSDNKKLIATDGDGKPTPNSIGYRFSWIKMSEPSIESLRQAFLDHDSRIVLPENVSTDIHPAVRIKQAQIQSISIKGVAFLANQNIHFSPNMNCVIGGRGSGKSMLLEYLRIILGKDKAKDLDPGTKDRIKRVRDTLNAAGAELEVCWRSADGVEDRIVWRNGSPSVINRKLPDPDTFFSNLPIRFYSQQQLNRLTESKTDDGSVRQAQRLLELVDGFTQSELDDLGDQERKIKLQIQDAFNNLRKAESMDKELKRLQQEHQDLDRQWKARSEIQEDARRHQLLKSENSYLEEMFGTPGKRFSDVASLAESIAAAHVAFALVDSPHGDWFQQFDSNVKAAKDDLARTIRDAVDRFNNAIEGLKTHDPAWVNIKNELDQADTKFSEACALKGLTTDDVGHLQEISESRSKKQKEIDETAAEIQKLKDLAGDPERLIRCLQIIWKKQYQKRAKAARRANKLAVLQEGRQRFIEVTTKYQCDFNNFRELWQGFAPTDGRTRLGRNWENHGQKLYDLFMMNDVLDSPWQLLHERLSIEDGSVGSDFGETSKELYQHIQANREAWEKLRCSRVRDTVDMKLFRADGTIAGSIAEGLLSDGQRNTAALALLLAQEGGPLVIDQPEDELDSNFVFRELIPMLRKVKSKRQLIMATHNANLPVNGDSELVYAFEARDGHGVALAQGGLDKGVVTKAVLDIMEGTEEAFRRRREKYHF
ncbi:DNA repair ATPase RecN [Syntrophus gentianae]|uniref:DNA repair ATPase RecN n=1 Tax=Syntrophus gentianae TaxID=43775 RepID=A0A1H8ACU2_9BACT|nr:AAA family ATPase [Syntrophus gentianae]SEM68682.1 DNA repair ATPase RecN [Syntrophus gentianae]